MNKGEKNELILKVYLCYLKKKNDKNSPFGLIKSLGFDENFLGVYITYGLSNIGSLKSFNNFSVTFPIFPPLAFLF